MTSTVALFVFNRPEITARTLQRIREAKPDRLFLIADGPRDHVATDAARCAEVRALVNDVDWPCEVSRRFSEVNLGLKQSLQTGLDWVFEQTDDAIVLEDDCVPDPSFFAYAVDLLEHYRDDGSVGQISALGSELVQPMMGDASYGFAAIGGIWGWATWAGAWKDHRANDPAAVYAEGLEAGAVRLVSPAGRRFFDHLAANVETLMWDHAWALHLVGRGSLAVIPATNLVENAGFGVESTHTRSEIHVEPAKPLRQPLRHPDTVELNAEVEAYLEQILHLHQGRLARWAAALPWEPVRKVMRRLRDERYAALRRSRHTQ